MQRAPSSGLFWLTLFAVIATIVGYADLSRSRDRARAAVRSDDHIKQWIVLHAKDRIETRQALIARVKARDAALQADQSR